MALKLLFVCLGNICRSPAAENIMNYLLQQEKPQLSSEITCDSAGTWGYHAGSPPDRRMIQAAAERGLVFIGASRKLQKSDLEDFDLILAMDRDNYYDILTLDAHGKYQHKVKMMCDYCTKYTLKEVPDPYYGGKEGFNQVIDLLFDACDGLLQELKQKL